MVTYEQKLELTNSMIKSFIINVVQICNNSDNEMEDIYSEAYIIVDSMYDEIIKNKRVFINELKKKCLKHNKYGKRIESSKVWKRFNDIEHSLRYRMKTFSTINENSIFANDIISKIGSDENKKFIMDYYDNGSLETARMYGISEGYCRIKAFRINNRIKKIIY